MKSGELTLCHPTMMRRQTAVLTFFFLLISGLLAAAVPAQGDAQGPALTLAQFQAQLDRLNSQITGLETQPQNAEALRKSLPRQWTVTGGPHPVEVGTKTLDDALTAFQKEGAARKKTILRELHTQLSAIRAEGDGYTQPEATDAAMRKRLDDILAAREFGDEHGPSLFELWRERVDAWLRKWWDKLFGNLHLTPPGIDWLGRIFVWLVICAATCLLAVWLLRVYLRKPVEYTREIIPFAPSAKSWRIWLAEARGQAERGDWRNAIHLAYWASVSYLEASGLWIPDRARTPREYLRAVDARDPKKQPFTALTRRFENVWYCSRQAGPADFDATLAELEKIGCQ
ncbi:MAG: DUF4129 domain-containing protein [Bryobacteraceae bacterium]